MNSKKYKIFVEGQSGTTGLEIKDRLTKHPNVELMTIDYEKRRDVETRKQFLNEADVVFLCLPDDAARESVSLITNPNTIVIDPSTAHRTNDDWVYGIPELDKNQRERIKNSKRITVPGCHATGFILTVAPLIKEGILPKDYPITAHSITGYSGGGKNLISKYEDATNEYLKIPRHYALSLNHKHLPEMKKHTGLINKPIFTPILSNYYKGMGVSIPLFSRFFNKKLSANELCNFYSEYFKGEKLVSVMPFDSEEFLYDGGFVITTNNDTNKLDLFVFGDDERSLVMTRYDNLGKGASGAAVQCMNIVLGVEETL